MSSEGLLFAFFFLYLKKQQTFGYSVLDVLHINLLKSVLHPLIAQLMCLWHQSEPCLPD